MYIQWTDGWTISMAPLCSRQIIDKLFNNYTIYYDYINDSTITIVIILYSYHEKW